MTKRLDAGYRDFLRDSQRRQRLYIASENRRMNKARRLIGKYHAAMSALGLHPLTMQEIADRQRELEAMLWNVKVTHGDTEANRAIYESHTRR